MQLFIIKAIYSFHAVFKVNIKSKLTLCTFLMHILGLIVNNLSVHILLKKNSFINVYQNDFTKVCFCFNIQLYLEIHQITELKPGYVWHFMLALAFIHLQLSLMCNVAV